VKRALRLCCRASVTHVAKLPALPRHPRTSGLTHPASPRPRGQPWCCSLHCRLLRWLWRVHSTRPPRPRSTDGRIYPRTSALVAPALSPTSFGDIVVHTCTRLCATLPPVAHGREHHACLDRASHGDVATVQSIIESGASGAPRPSHGLDANALMKEDWTGRV
jgi:hypothetical protein